jgi:hypothetical protein
LREDIVVDSSDPEEVMKIENRAGEALPEATISLDEEEVVDLLEALADVAEGNREHIHLSQAGGPQLVVRRAAEEDPDPLGRQMDWWVGPLVLAVALLTILGAATLIRWVAGFF